jgi:hypothetical protein
LRLFGHHLIVEPEVDRQHIAHPTLPDAAAQLAAAGHLITDHCGARLGAGQPHRRGPQLPKLSTRIYVALDDDGLVSSPHKQARTEISETYSAWYPA